MLKYQIVSMILFSKVDISKMPRLVYLMHHGISENDINNFLSKFQIERQTQA